MGVTRASTDSEAFTAAHRRLLADASLQFDMRAAERPRPPAWLQPLIDFLRDNADIIRPLFYGALIAFGLWIAWRLGTTLYRHWHEREVPPEAGPDWRPGAAAARRLLDEADALAGIGRFGDAAHLLLFRSIEDIDTHRPDLVRGSLTSREIARAQRLPDAARPAFGTIASLVERSLFAQRPLDASGWEQARAAYSSFAFEGHWA